MDTRHALVETVLGGLTLVAGKAAGGDALVGLYFPRYRYTPPAWSLGRRVDAPADPVLAQAASELSEYFAGRRRVFGVPAVTDGDEFQERVWALLREIPFGERITYGDIAVELGDKTLAQPVGQAVGRNPVSIVIPCHRVVGAGGKLTGFGGGLARKQALLELEEPTEVKAGRLF
ncbi:methylated-DNA--[protein]-cysteine S-methyltransferase [Streptomyces sp. NPDC058464]|uniref:methylated-DNA--[protein]-cysteine S-methyltransferase n=1 Tax=Streptomyces sp. NPDC058464 TaxID=3346511 RepID=UPI003661F3C7